MSVLRRATRGLNAFAQFGDSSILPNSAMAGLGISGGLMTEPGALAIATVLNCVKVLCSDISILPLNAYSGDKLGVKSLMETQPTIITQPFGPDVPTKNGISQIVMSLVLRGRAFLYIAARDPRTNFPTLLTIVHPDVVQVRRNMTTGEKYYLIRGQTFTTDEIIHIPNLSIPGSADGMDPITYMRITLGLASDRQAYGSAFYRNATTPSGVISVPGQGDRKKAREVKEAWEAGHAGIGNAHRPAVLFGGASWAQLSVNPDQAQFLATGQYLREEICGWFGVPLQRIQATPNGNAPAGKGLDTIDQGYATHTLLPITVAIEDVWDTLIPGNQATWSQFNYAGLLRANAMERAQIAQIHRLTGVRNRNEIRADEGWAPIDGPDGDDYNLPFNTNSTVPPLLDPNTGLPPALDADATDGATA